MRFKPPLACGLLLMQVILAATPYSPARAQGLYGAGYQLTPPQRHHRDSTDAPAPTNSPANEPPAPDTHVTPVSPPDTFSISPSNTRSSESTTSNSTVKPRVGSEGPLHDQDKTADPWFADAEKTYFLKKRLAENSEKIQKEPRNCDLYISCADAHLHLGQSNESIEDSNKAIDLNPASKMQLSNAYCNRGEAKLQLKRYDEGIKDLIKAISLDDENAEAIYFRGMARERLGQLEMAMKDYAVARDLGFAPKGVKVDYSEYMAEMQRAIKKNWHPVRTGSSRKTVVCFHLLRNGQVENVRMDSDTDSAGSNEAAMAAVKNAAPFPALPKGAPRAVDIAFNFDYNVIKDGVPLPPVAANSARAEEEGKASIAAAEKSGDEKTLFNALIKLGDNSRERGSLTNAAELYKKAQTVLEKRGDNGIDKAKILARLAMIDTLQDKRKDAETLYNQSLEIALQAGKPRSDPDTGEILRGYAKLLYKDSRFDDVKKMYDRFKAQ